MLKILLLKNTKKCVIKIFPYYRLYYYSTIYVVIIVDYLLSAYYGKIIPHNNVIGIPFAFIFFGILKIVVLNTKHFVLKKLIVK